ncbi:hypothetical protein ACFL1M_03815, partial [Patescibacteria group bacterium]
PAGVKTVGFDPQLVTYAGIYGHLGPGGWGTLSEYTTGEQAAQAAIAYANQIDSINGSRQTIALVNIVARNEQASTIEEVINACSPMRCIVMIDISPQEDVESVINDWGYYENVWIDIDLEHAGSPTSASQFNEWASQYFTLRIKNGLITPGVFAFYDFRSDPWLTPPAQVQWTYPNGYVIPIYDGHCRGEPCKAAKWNATTGTLQNYSQAPATGIMEFSTRWGCGSVYGDCGFTLKEYYDAYTPLIFMSQ